ncbi:MAG: type II toxin-antitoxin system VapC family toxin [Salinarimonas sp.]
MFVDASALVAIIARETGWEQIAERMASHTGVLHVSPLVRFEATLAVARVLRADASPMSKHIAASQSLVDALIADIGAHDVTISDEVGRLALDAAGLYGKAVGHAAQLNFGDCFAYACAKTLDTGLIYKGDDFSLTDLA